MARITTFGPGVTLALVLAALASPLQAQGYPTTGDSIADAARATTVETARRFRALAPKLVESAGIKHGDLVSISGGPAMVEEMEALGAAVQKAGGTPVLVLNSPLLTRTLYANVPEKHLGQIPTAWDKFYAQQVDVEFNLPSGEDFATVRRVDPARRTLVDQA